MIRIIFALMYVFKINIAFLMKFLSLKILKDKIV